MKLKKKSVKKRIKIIINKKNKYQIWYENQNKPNAMSRKWKTKSIKK